MHSSQIQSSASARSAVLTKAAINAAERLGLSGRTLADVLGVSEAQVSRFRNGETVLAERTKSFELAALLVRLFRSLDAITGGDPCVARHWLQNPNDALGSRPADRIVTVQGLVDVVAYLDARRAPI
ncbi:antitoxin Xre/MbcA/ParS toxin-binding domain-containing protein [Roseibium sp. RKSG952]|uniref:antitoxin Xre/MbcA/ParS toxin-binding domain-containing protein n=1 Tax=Roseibium sp. RKSG952 TaxID=2529384 RepID=UPI0012BCAADA|nr:antitoxin Xre/MbcA/ParS toxin-binding domain-containing protein [Roseibium sp. RKSG952]MTH94790.1 helix-turn-helix domain-containing protein [Roseibium sp. RKSG952]